MKNEKLEYWKIKIKKWKWDENENENQIKGKLLKTII